MGNVYRILEHMADRAELETEPMPAQPIVEIAGDQRVLVENHRGIIAYSTEKILVNVAFGAVCICGCGSKRTKKRQIYDRKAVSLQNTKINKNYGAAGKMMLIMSHLNETGNN